MIIIGKYWFKSFYLLANIIITDFQVDSRAQKRKNSMREYLHQS